MLKLFILLPLFFTACVHKPHKHVSEQVAIYIYPDGLVRAAIQSEIAIHDKFEDIFRHVGRKGPNGEVGIGIVFPYLSWTEGAGKGPYQVPEHLKNAHEAIVRVATQLKVPLLIQFNGAVWHSPSRESAFLTHWKTVDGGKFLSRYQDGQVNEDISDTGLVPSKKLMKYLETDPYSSEKQNSLFFTLSPFADEFRAARIETLGKAVRFWKEMDQKYPGTIKAFTTDSEVSNFSFRDQPSEKREIPIGFESWNTKPFCEIHSIRNCQAFFLKKDFKYSEPLEQKWFEFRSKNHQTFVQDTVFTIRKFFPDTPVFTHQIAILDEENPLQKYRKQDLASPQWTAFVDKAFAGFTVYTYAGDKHDSKKRFVEQVHSKAGQKPWGFLEFNTARAFTGSKKELTQFTKNFLKHAQAHGVRVVAPLAWESNSLDNAVKGSGVDEGIRQFIEAKSSDR